MNFFFTAFLRASSRKDVAYLRSSLNKLMIGSRGIVIGLFLIVASCLMIGIQQTSAMMVSPVMYDVQIDQGASIEREIQLKNDTKQKAFYTISSENFISQGEDGGQMYLPNSNYEDLASWMSWSKEKIVVDPGATVRVPIKIQVPNSAEPGGHYATVFISRVSEGEEKDSVGMTEQIGVLFLVRVSGEVTERAYITSFELRGSSDETNRLPAIFDVRIQNDGSVHIRPEGYIVITNMLGKVVAKIPLNQKEGAVLPSGTRRFESTWKKQGNADYGTGFWNEVKAEWSQFSIGRYTAEIQAVYGSRMQQFPRLKEVIWIFPWHLFLIAIGVLVALIGFVKLYTHCLICRLISRSNAKNKTRRSRS